MYNIDHNEPLKPALKQTLANYRKQRGFEAETYIDAKATLINQYFEGTPLKTAIVLLSGGIDSSVVASLANHAKRQEGSLIENIVLTTMPAYVSGATGQSDAANRAYDVMDSLGVPRLTQDVSGLHREMVRLIETTRGQKLNEWGKGQIVAHLRTATAAADATFDAMIDKPGIVLGTTNRDEGSYLGYVGKWSDGMVDKQIISDLHKSEVYAVARALDLPQSTINAIPKGDMYDNRADTEVFGAPYDFVELYTGYYLQLSEQEKANFLGALDNEARDQFNGMAGNLENLHRYNAHKYLGNQPGSPAYHMNILPSAVPGGWTSGKFGREYAAPNNPEKNFNGYFKLSEEFLARAELNTQAQTIDAETRFVTGADDLHPKQATILKPLISKGEADDLIAEAQNAPWVPAGLDGYKLKSPGDLVGSWRATVYSTEYAKTLWDRIAGNIPMIVKTPAGSSIDAHNQDPQARVWRAVGVNPAMRFIKYDPKAENLLFPHYDAPPMQKNTPDTLDSLVIYLTDGEAGMGGETAFIKDPQAQTPALERNNDDWTRVARDEEILTSVIPKQGLGLIFPHRALHSSVALKPDAEEKIIIRTDIIYEAISSP